MTRVWTPHWHWETVDLKRCRARVADGERSVGFHQCRRKPVTEPDADGLRWCAQHSPAATAARERASAERGAAEGRAIKAQWAAKDEAARYEALGRAAEPILREIQAQQQAAGFSGGNAAAIDAALALLEAPHS